jgi:uncharacterized protein YqgQ
MNYIQSYCRILPGRVILNGEVCFDAGGKPYAMPDFLSALYESLGVEYRKFYRMDALSKLGFLAAELVLRGMDRDEPKEHTGIVLFNRSASLEADRTYQQTIRDKNHFFPSPADFVYTLPNIVAGEIAIRNKIFGETAFRITPDFRCDRLCEAINDMIRYGDMTYVLGGWTEVAMDAGTWSCLMTGCKAGDPEDGGAAPADVYSPEGKPAMPLVNDNLKKLYDKG